MSPGTHTRIPPHVEANPRLGTWVSVIDDVGEHVVCVRVGKVELGQGILTALGQLAADSLGLPLRLVRVLPARTDGPDQGVTSGSMSVQHSVPTLRYVGAAVRTLAEAPASGGGGPTPNDDEDARELDAYVRRIAALDPDTDLTGIPLTDATTPGPTSLGTDAPRVDLPDKVLGQPRFLADLRPHGLLHARVLRPPSPAATLRALAEDWSSPGVTLVRDGSFLGVVGAREDDVDRALDHLAEGAAWDEHDSLPDEDDLTGFLRTAPSEEVTVLDEEPGVPTHRATYSRSYLAHASIAPSCAMARWAEDGRSVHVWSHSQGIHNLRKAVADALGIDRGAVSIEHAENAGCYGHNGADDAAYDAVLLARTTPGRPVMLRWTRRDELTWSPFAPAMTAELSARLVDGRIDGWSHDVWSQGHTSRPGYAGHPGLLATSHTTGGTPLPPATDPPPQSGHGGLRNAVPGYRVGPRRVTGHRVTQAPLRTSAMRALGAHLNVFAIESFIDELASDAGIDTVEFRLAHLDDERARSVLERAAHEADWGTALPDGTGRGVAVARYKGTGAWCAVVAQVEMDREVRVTRLVLAADVGTVVNPDGARNQLAGGAVQATSWTTIERVRFDRRRVTSADWETYPVMRFPDAPRVDVHLVPSTEPSLGAGEAAQGPTAGAIANAVHAALGVRVRDLPIDAAAVVAAIERDG